MGFLRQIQLLLWKNWTLRKRQKVTGAFCGLKVSLEGGQGGRLAVGKKRTDLFQALNLDQFREVEQGFPGHWKNMREERGACCRTSEDLRFSVPVTVQSERI